MSFLSLRRSRGLTGPLALVLALAVPAASHAAPKVVADPGPASSLSALYGRAVPLGDPSVAGLYAIPTGTGLEVRDAAAPAPEPVGRWRSSGSIGDLAVDGTTAYLFAGTRGVLIVDLATPATPRLIGSRVDAEPALLGASLPVGGGLVVSDGTGLRLYRRTAPASLARLSSVGYADGRAIRAIRARADSFLVASERSTPVTRLVLTLYRLPS